MDENKIFDLLEKIYVEVQETKSEAKSNTTRLDNIELEVRRIGILIDHKLIPTNNAILDEYKNIAENIEIIDNKIDRLQMNVNNISNKEK